MSPPADRLPPRRSERSARLASAVPARVRRTVLARRRGAALTTAGHVTAAILKAGGARSWTPSLWFLEPGRWSWLAVLAAGLALLGARFTPPVWHVLSDDPRVERGSARVLSAAQPERRGQRSITPLPPRHTGRRSGSGRAGSGWPRWSSAAGAAVVERGWTGGAVPLLLRLVRRQGQGRTLATARRMMQ